MPFPGGYSPEKTRAAGQYYDAAQADRCIRFFSSCLRHVEGKFAGQPFVPHPDQEELLRALFGWRRRDGSRRYRTLAYFVPRGNGKTTLAAAIATYCLLAAESPPEKRAQVYCCASEREQASLCYGIVADMIRGEPVLAKRCQIRPSVKRILVPETGSYLRAIASKAESAHGFNPSAIIFDELHCQPNRDLWDALETAKGKSSRANPLTVAISTSGWDRQSICYEVYSYACRVRDGVVANDSFLPVIYEAPEKADWTDELIWQSANPGLGRLVSVEHLRQKCQEAQDNPASEGVFRRLHLNQWTSQETRWISMSDWRSLESSTSAILPGDCVYAGLDLSNTQDLTAWVLAKQSGNGYAIKTHCWLPADTVERRERADRVPYSQWAREGWLTICPGAVVDRAYVEQRILDDADAYQLAAVGYDPWTAEGTRQRLEQQGVTMCKIPQGIAHLTEPSKEFEQAILSGNLVTDGSPVMDWCVENVSVYTDPSGNIRPVKPPHTSGKRIDLVVAAVMAIGLCKLQAGESPQRYSPACFVGAEDA